MLQLLKDNLAVVEKNIADACKRAGRSRSDVTLVAVSKTKPNEMIGEVYALGVRDFGENYPQELKAKHDTLPSDIRWHMIGHLQRNKVKYLIERVCMIHSVDTEELAETISEQAVKHHLVMPVLAEVNMAEEDTKFGIRPQDAEDFVRRISVLPGIAVRGLMTIAPYVENPEDNRVHFRNLKNLSIDIGRKNIDNVAMCELSMGMTNDYVVAVEEGATLVRVGTGIFGARDYSAAI